MKKDKMKQHITIKQLDDLSLNALNKLRKWWGKRLPQKGDIEMAYFYNVTTQESHRFESVTTEEYKDLPVYIKKGLPLLSIGQMIEFLDDKTKLIMSHNQSRGWFVEGKNRVELCDALWEAVKEVLEKGNLRTS